MALAISTYERCDHTFSTIDINLYSPKCQTSLAAHSERPQNHFQEPHPPVLSCPLPTSHTFLCSTLSFPSLPSTYIPISIYIEYHQSNPSTLNTFTHTPSPTLYLLLLLLPLPLHPIATPLLHSIPYPYPHPSHSHPPPSEVRDNPIQPNPPTRIPLRYSTLLYSTSLGTLYSPAPSLQASLQPSAVGTLYLAYSHWGRPG